MINEGSRLTEEHSLEESREMGDGLVFNHNIGVGGEVVKETALDTITDGRQSIHLSCRQSHRRDCLLK